MERNVEGEERTDLPAGRFSRAGLWDKSEVWGSSWWCAEGWRDPGGRVERLPGDVSSV